MPQKLNEKSQQAAAEFARRVTSALGGQVDTIVLYGSVARGETRRDSDIDILVVSPDPHILRKEVGEICEAFTYERDYSFFISVVHLGRGELDWHIRVRSPFIHNVFEEGVILYDNGTFSRVREGATAASRRSPG
ncbi:MAG TPA: nucleotidyltransferase domain-containing protein [Dehalococcoidia bacterium]|jgi:predicted nucleotidyltransferase|nr:nucleotidyltransferase domain-containing protein [Dehalococcoidia bacterium]